MATRNDSSVPFWGRVLGALGGLAFCAYMISIGIGVVFAAWITITVFAAILGGILLPPLIDLFSPHKLEKPPTLDFSDNNRDKPQQTDTKSKKQSRSRPKPRRGHQSRSKPQHVDPASLKSLMARSDLKGTDLLRELNNIPFLKTLYKKDAGVRENKTIYTHSLDVLSLADKYYNPLFVRITGSIPKNTFLLFLALHDIGKGKALEDVHSVKRNLNKSTEFGYTSQAMRDVFTSLDLPDHQLKICLALVKEDVIGPYIRGIAPYSDINCAAEKIKSLAQEAEMNEYDFFNLFADFYKFDAASYPRVMERHFQTYDSTNFNLLIYTPETHEKIDSLLDRVCPYLNEEETTWAAALLPSFGSPLGTQPPAPQPTSSSTTAAAQSTHQQNKPPSPPHR